MEIHLQLLWKSYQNILMTIHKKTHLLLRQMGLRQYKKLQKSNLSYSILRCEPYILRTPLHIFSQYDNREYGKEIKCHISQQTGLGKSRG